MSSNRKSLKRRMGLRPDPYQKRAVLGEYGKTGGFSECRNGYVRGNVVTQIGR